MSARHRLKALTYFDDAQREPELVMLRPVDWVEVRSFLEREVRAVCPTDFSERSDQSAQQGFAAEGHRLRNPATW